MQPTLLAGPGRGELLCARGVGVHWGRAAVPHPAH
jgi:hypothetical protein